MLNLAFHDENKLRTIQSTQNEIPGRQFATLVDNLGRSIGTQWVIQFVHNMPLTSAFVWSEQTWIGAGGKNNLQAGKTPSQQTFSFGSTSSRCFKCILHRAGQSLFGPVGDPLTPIQSASLAKSLFVSHT